MKQIITFITQTIRDLTSLPQAALVIIGGNFINRLGHFVMPFLALYLSRKGYSLTDSGLALGAHGLGLLAASFLGGYLADHIGRKPTILISLVGNGLTIIALGLMNDLSGILLCAGLTGLSSGLYPSAANALIADVVNEDMRPTAFATVRLAVNAGFACGAALAGFLMAGPLWILFAVDATTSLIYAGLCAALLPRLRSRHRSDAKRSGARGLGHVFGEWKATFRHLARNTAYQRLLFAMFPTILVFMQIFSTLGVSLKAAGLQEFHFGLLLGINGLLVISSEVVITRLVKRFRKPVVLASGFVLIGIGAAGFGWAQSMAGMSLAMVVFTIGEMLALPTAMAYSATLAPAEMRGRYMGLGTLNWSLGSLIAPATGFWLLENVGLISWNLCGVLGIIAATVILWPLPSFYRYRSNSYNLKNPTASTTAVPAFI
ncbi:MAG: MFS transporter [Verrucomicrobiota bacterium]